MTSHQQRVLDCQDIRSLTFLAVRHPELDRKLLATYKRLHRHTPRDLTWSIDEGPSTLLVTQKGPATFKFRIAKNTEQMWFTLESHVAQATAIGENGYEWIIVATGTLWRYGINDRDDIKAENISIPCYYNSHTRKGFGLVPLLTSYEVFGASSWDLNRPD